MRRLKNASPAIIVTICLSLVPATGVSAGSAADALKAHLSFHSVIKLQPGINQVEFAGPLRTSEEQDGPLEIIPFRKAGHLVVLESWMSVGGNNWHRTYFATAEGLSKWSVVPMGDDDSISTEPGIGGAIWKSVRFYQGTSDGSPETLLVVAARTPKNEKDSIDESHGWPFLVSVYKFEWGYRNPDGGWMEAPSFELVGSFLTRRRYDDSDDVLAAELHLSRIQ